MGMGKSVNEVGVEDLVRAGVAIEEAIDFERQLKDAINGCDEFDPKELWRELMARKLLKPWHPHGVHQLIYYSVYHNYDESIHGPPLYWFPTPNQCRCTNLGRIMESHCPRLLGALYKDPITSFREFQKFSVQHPEVYWSIILNELSIHFSKAPKCILDTLNKSKHGGTWLPGSALNIADCCLRSNKYLKKQDDSLAIVWRDEGCDDQTVEHMTLKQLREEVMYALSHLA